MVTSLFLPETRMKPKQGSFDSGLIAPEWRSLARSIGVHIPFWEGGGAPRDISPNRIPTTISDAPPWVSSPFGLAMSFAGADRVEFTEPPWLLNLPGTYNFSIEFWFNRANVSTDGAACAWEGTDDLVIYPNDNLTGSGSPRIFWRDLGGSIIDPGGADLSGEWHHFLFTSRAPNDHEAYLDAVSIGTSSGTGAAGPFDAFRIGGFTVGDQPFTGDMLLMRVFRRALTDGQVRQLFLDRFGPLRMMMPFVWKSPAVVGGDVRRHIIPAYRAVN